MAFSVAKPFRQPIWTNTPFTLCAIALITIGTLSVLLPDGNLLAKLFDLLPFASPNGGGHGEDYRALVTAGILLNTLATLGAENIITGPITDWADKRRLQRKRD